MSPMRDIHGGPRNLAKEAGDWLAVLVACGAVIALALALAGKAY